MVQEEQGGLLDLIFFHIAELKREIEFLFKDLILLQLFCTVHCCCLVVKNMFMEVWLFKYKALGLQ